MAKSKQRVLFDSTPLITSLFGADFVQHWERWCRYKKDQFRFTFKSQDSEETAIKRLHRLSAGNAATAASMIEESIANTWSGIFELKKGNNGQHSVHPSDGSTGTSGKRIEKLQGW